MSLVDAIFARRPRSILPAIGQARAQRLVNTYRELIQAVAYFRGTGKPGTVVIAADIVLEAPVVIPNWPVVAGATSAAVLTITHGGGVLFAPQSKCDAAFSIDGDQGVIFDGINLYGDSKDVGVATNVFATALYKWSTVPGGGAAAVGQIQVSGGVLNALRIGNFGSVVISGVTVVNAGVLGVAFAPGTTGTMTGCRRDKVVTGVQNIGSTTLLAVGNSGWDTTPGVDCHANSTGNDP
jgi:hypothetical protein